MTRDHLTAAQRATAALFLGEHGWGYGMAAPGPRQRRAPDPVGLRLERRHRHGVVAATPHAA